MESQRASGKSRPFCVSLSLALVLVACGKSPPEFRSVEPPPAVVIVDAGPSLPVIHSFNRSAGTAESYVHKVTAECCGDKRGEKRAEAAEPTVPKVVKAQVKAQVKAVKRHKKKVAKLKKDAEEVKKILKAKKTTMSKPDYLRWKKRRRKLLLQMEQRKQGPQRRVPKGGP